MLQPLPFPSGLSGPARLALAISLIDARKQWNIFIHDDLLEVTLWNLNQVNIVNTSPPSSTAHIHKLFTQEGYRESLEARRRWHEMCDGEDESAQKWKSD
ncbi:hypothetical protein GGF50DRAFT_115649 [Schizophyllum commune]